MDDLGEWFTVSIAFAFGVKTHNRNSWPKISNYNQYISEAIENDKLIDEGHVWYILVMMGREAGSKGYDPTGSGKFNRIGKIFREAILSKYSSVQEYIDKGNSPIKKRYLLKFLNGGALPRENVMNQIAKSLGHANVVELVRDVFKGSA